MIARERLNRMYVDEGRSMQEIASLIGCSLHTVAYWMKQHGLASRSMSEASYRKHHPDGDPFRFVPPKNNEEARLFGLGLGIYWGEGNKANVSAVRVGNTDPALLRAYILFLERFFSISRAQLKCHLQIFTDIDPNTAQRYWIHALNLNREQFYKTTVTVSGSLGTYRRKSQYGVLSVHYGNAKLKKLLLNFLPT